MYKVVSELFNLYFENIFLVGKKIYFCLMILNIEILSICFLFVFFLFGYCWGFIIMGICNYFLLFGIENCFLLMGMFGGG